MIVSIPRYASDSHTLETIAEQKANNYTPINNLKREIMNEVSALHGTVLRTYILEHQSSDWIVAATTLATEGAIIMISFPVDDHVIYVLSESTRSFDFIARHAAEIKWKLAKQKGT